MKNKKGAIPFAVVIVVMMVFVLIYAWTQFSSKYNQFGKNIGERQYSIINTYQEAEKVLFFIDQSAKYSLRQSVYELAQNGGIIKDYTTEGIDRSGLTEDIAKNEDKNKCRDYYGYTLWHELRKESPESGYIKKSCFDGEKVQDSLKTIFNKNLNQYLAAHPDNIPIDNYDYEFKNDIEIIGMAREPLIFDILKEPAKETLKEAVETPEGLVDFTGTEMCKKGVRCLLTKGAFELLGRAQEIAKKKEVSLEVTFGYRTFAEQEEIWKKNPDPIYVCPPSPSCPHLSGDAVDIRFKAKTFDTMTNSEWEELHNIMAEAGWVRYTREPWHFECCDTPRYARAKSRGVTQIV